jgi:hypothetical protein
LFQEGFAVSGKEFRSRESVFRRWRGGASGPAPQHPLQIFFIFASNFEFSTASKSANGVWLGVSDTVAGWFGGTEVLDAADFFPAVGGVALS